MRLRRLLSLGILVSLLVGASVDAGEAIKPLLKKTNGFLIHQQSGNAVTVQAYEPRAGDIVLYDNYSKFHHFVYKFANTSAPIHAAMVIARDDGTPALLELTGPHVITAKVCILDIEPRFTNYQGSIMVRRLREPLSPEQSRDLYSFARSHVGKSFAVGRIILQGSPFTAHSGWRRDLFGATYYNRHRWYCSEIVVAGGTKVGLFDPRVMPANATYPRDLAYDENTDLSSLYHPPLWWISDQAVADKLAPER